ncbi:lipopolysaccharide biosynthesis protein [Piscibacillus halophilus]|uniref:lipopolysaccharide biosynthesis protein n=1 Tax=Piscibacillus halophilus TaxID=571933 RepID=UPI00158C3BBE|nr:oligosaccharide flippase family protein [Piscibacillus halophilus]
MSTLFQNLNKSKFIRNIAIVASGTIAAQIINFGLTPVITRIYGPDAFGLLGTFMAVINILGPIAALTYPIAIVLPKEHSKAKQITKLALLVCLCVGVILGITLLFAFDMIVKLFNLHPIAPFLFLIPIVVVFSGILQIVEQWLIRTRQFKVTAKTAMFQSLLVNSSKIGVGLLHPFAISLVLIQTFGIALKGILMFVMSDRSLYLKDNSKEQRSLKDIAFDYKDFPLYRAPQVFFNAISQGLPIILLASFFGPATAGFYTLSRQALGIPVQILGKAVQDVFYPRVSEAANKKENISRIIIKSVLGLTILGIVPFGVIIAFGPFIFSFVFGVEWEVAGVYAQWIALMSLFMLITRPVIVSVPVLRIQKQFLFFEIIGTIFKIGALVFGFYYFQSDIYAVALFSITSMCTYIILTLYTLSVAKRSDVDSIR